MNLVGYSDSESDGETAPAPKPAPKQAPKPSFARVVDRANPGKIRVNLPGAPPSQPPRDDIESDAPPAKKPRLGGSGAFGGFNAMLPAPKKAAATTAAPAASAAPGRRALGKGLAAGVSLKTGAEPAFQRASRTEVDEYDENGDPVEKQPMNKDDFRAMLNLPPPKSDKKETPKMEPPVPPSPQPALHAQPKPAPRFVPMSVGKGKKKKPLVPRASGALVQDASRNATAAPENHAATTAAPPARKPKVSLFGATSAAPDSAITPTTSEYQPLLHGTEDEGAAHVAESGPAAQYTQFSQPPGLSASAPSNELTDIASELNLSEAERRQLFGKKGRGADFASARIVEFNTDTEYAHNEKLRQQGEQVQHNPLKSISGTGKNSLRSLVNVASTQKDALEDHIAAGHRNKKEAGNRYGW